MISNSIWESPSGGTNVGGATFFGAADAEGIIIADRLDKIGLPLRTNSVMSQTREKSAAATGSIPLARKALMVVRREKVSVRIEFAPE